MPEKPLLDTLLQARVINGVSRSSSLDAWTYARRKMTGCHRKMKVVPEQRARMRRPVHATAGAFLQMALQCGVLVCFLRVSVAASICQILVPA